MKYYEDCRLNIEWWTDATDGASRDGGFESDPGTVNEVLSLLDRSYGTDYHARVTDFDGGLERKGRPLTRKQIQRLAEQQEKYYKEQS